MEHKCNIGWSGEGVNSQGRCCCNCEHQKELMQHPWNKFPGATGSIKDHMGWICAIPDFFPKVIFFDRKHGMCECHEFRDYSKYSPEHTFEALRK